MRAICLISLATLMLMVSAPAFASWTEQVFEPVVENVAGMPAPLAVQEYLGENTDEPPSYMKVYRLQQTFKPYPAFLNRNSPANPATVPEPGSLVALGAGLIGLMIRRRK